MSSCALSKEQGFNRFDPSRPLIQAVPPIRGKRGRPRRRPEKVYTNRGYDHDVYRDQVRALGIALVITRRGTGHGSGLGVHRWVVEAAFALLYWFRRQRFPPTVGWQSAAVSRN